jgi:hypothetical protein
MKKKTGSSKLSLDKETIAKLNEEQLSTEQTQQVEGGGTGFTSGAGSCCDAGGGTYTSCCKV